MLLALDIGNTNIVAGVFDGEQLLAEKRIETHPVRTDYGTELEHELSAYGANFSGCIIASVVPGTTPALVDWLEREHALKPLLVDHTTCTGIRLATEQPQAVGADRIVNVVALSRLYGVPGMAVDFGTATTFDLVDREAVFHGGIIAPGIGICRDALANRTAKLPLIDLTWPRSVLGNDTVSSMQSGLVLGQVCMVDGLIERIVAEIGEIPHIVATGGLGALIASKSTHIKIYDPQLTIKGLRLIAELNGLN